MSDQAAKSGEWPAWARTPGDADLSANLRKQRFAETVGEPCARWVDAVAAADEIARLRARITHLTAAIAPWAPCKRPLGCDHPDCECGSQRPPDMLEQAVAALTSTCNYDLAAYVTDLARWVDALQTAIATHHATKHGSEPATARSVRSPVDRTLYEAAGTPHAVLAWDAGRDGGGV